MRAERVMARRTAVWLVLISCLACRRSNAQAELDVTIRPAAVSLAVGDTITLKALVAVASGEAPATVMREIVIP